MKKLALLSLFVILFGAFASAQILFYSGDLNLNDPNQNGLANENDAIVGGSPYGAATYQNFTLTQSYPVTALFTNNLSGLNPTTAYWEIRSGVSEGNGGTLIASGTGGTSNQATGRSDFGFIEYTNMVGMNLTLDPGTYWFAVVPNDPGNANRSYNSDTDGTNRFLGAGVSTTENLQYFNSAFFGANFTNANNEGVFSAFSGGVVTPEPSSMIMLGSGLLIAAGAFRRRLL